MQQVQSTSIFTSRSIRAKYLALAVNTEKKKKEKESSFLRAVQKQLDNSVLKSSRVRRFTTHIYIYALRLELKPKNTAPTLKKCPSSPRCPLCADHNDHPRDALYQQFVRDYAVIEDRIRSLKEQMEQEFTTVFVRHPSMPHHRFG